MSPTPDLERIAARELSKDRGGMLYAERMLLREGRHEELARLMERKNRRRHRVLVLFVVVGVLNVMAMLLQSFGRPTLVQAVVLLAQFIAFAAWIGYDVGRQKERLRFILEMLEVKGEEEPP